MAKSQTPLPHSGSSGGGFFGVVLVLMIAVIAGAFYYARRAPAHVATPPATTTSAQAGATAPRADPTPASDPMAQSDTPPDVAAGASIGADQWPADLPPLPLGSYEVSLPVGQVRAAYKFAAEHPEVENYVPCFCGCELGGHTSNESCFVASRDANGKVTGWDPHGMT